MQDRCRQPGLHGRRIELVVSLILFVFGVWRNARDPAKVEDQVRFLARTLALFNAFGWTTLNPPTILETGSLQPRKGLLFE